MLHHYRRFYQKSAPLLVCISIAMLVTACEKPPENSSFQKSSKIHLVEIETVSTSSLSVSRTRTGTLRTRREIAIHTQEEGKIIKHPYYEGDPVTKGDVLLRLDDTLLKVQLNRAVATRKQAQQDLNRLKKLRTKNIVSEDEYTQAQTRLELAKADEAIFTTRVGYTTVKSPIDGLVTLRLSQSGNIVQQYEHVLTISDPSTLFTEVRVSGLLIPHLAIGDIATIRIDPLGKQFYQGKVTRIYPTIDASTRQGTIEVELISVPEGAIAGQLCRVKLMSHATDRQVVQYSALRRDSESEYVYIVDETNIVQRRNVTTGLRLADKIEITEGLEDGQRIVIKGFLSLTPGKQVKPVNNALANND